MSDLALRLALTRSYLSKRSDLQPQVALVLGSGLSTLADIVLEPTSIAFDSIPNFLAPSVAGHHGRLHLGRTRGGTPVVVFDGRLHYYEGASLQQVAFPAYVAQALGASTFIVTNAAGGIDAGLAPGDLMLIRDHINLIGDNPLRGSGAPKPATRFPSLRDAYDPGLLDLALRTAARAGIPLHLGVYAAMSGPSYETDAELHMLYALGADAVGMSTVPEVIAARQVGMRVLALSVIANDAMPRRRRPPADIDHETVLHIVSGAAPAVLSLVEGVIEGLGM